MKTHGVTIALMGGICALVAAAATPASAGQAYLSRTGSGTTCSFAAPCGLMLVATPVAGANGEVICLDKGPYAGDTITQSITISCGDGLWEAPAGGVLISTPAGSDVIIEGFVN